MLEELDNYQKETFVRSAHKLVLQDREARVAALSQIQGHLYEYPIEFLAADLRAGNLKPDTISAEGVLPAKTFT